MSEKSATPILVAGAVGTVILLSIAWMFAASTSHQAVVDAENYAAEKLATAEAAATGTEAEKPAETDVANAEVEQPAETEATEEPAEIEIVTAESDEPAEAEAAADAEEVAKSVVVAAEEETPSVADAAAVTAVATTTVALEVEGDVKAGKKIFRKCRACHTIGGTKNSVGPFLTGVIGRVQGSADGYEKYSDGFKAAMAAGTVWTPEELNAFITKPKDYMPGTKMSFPGLSKAEDRANVIAFIAGQ